VPAASQPAVGRHSAPQKASTAPDAAATAAFAFPRTTRAPASVRGRVASPSRAVTITVARINVPGI
jgi:hypothetical protein